MYYAYVQQNLKGSWYKGHTANMTRRRVEHLLQWSPYSKRFGPSKLVYYKAFLTRVQAMECEKFMKTGKGRSFLKEVINTAKRTVK